HAGRAGPRAQRAASDASSRRRGWASGGRPPQPAGSSDFGHRGARSADPRRRRGRGRRHRPPAAHPRRRVPRPDRSPHIERGGMSAIAGRVGWGFYDTLALTWRNTLHNLRNPGFLVTEVLVVPVLFTILFAYVFGGAIHVPRVSYIDFLMPGIFV